MTLRWLTVDTSTTTNLAQSGNLRDKREGEFRIAYKGLKTLLVFMISQGMHALRKHEMAYCRPPKGVTMGVG